MQGAQSNLFKNLLFQILSYLESHISFLNFEFQIFLDFTFEFRI
jgi:hypothetical protein